MFANLSLILLLFGSRYRLPPSPPHIHPGRQCPRVIPYDTDLLKVAKSGTWYINRVTATSTHLRPYSCMKAEFTNDPKNKNGLILEFQGITTQERVETSTIRIGSSEPGNEGIFEIDPQARYLDLKATSIISHTKIGENEYIVVYACFYLPETHRYCDGAMILSRQPRLYLADLEVLTKDLNRRQERPLFMRHIFHNALCDLLDQKVKELHLKARNAAPLSEFHTSKSLAPLRLDETKHEKFTVGNNLYFQKKKGETNHDLEASNAHEKQTNDDHLDDGKSEIVLQNKNAVGKKLDKRFKQEQTKLKITPSASSHEDEDRTNAKDGGQNRSEPVITMNSRSLLQPQPAKCPYILSHTTPTPVLIEKMIDHPHSHDADGTSSEHKPEIVVEKPVVLKAKKGIPGTGEPKGEAKRKQNYPRNTRRVEPTRAWRTIKAATLRAPKHATRINKLQLPNAEYLKVGPAAFRVQQISGGKQHPLKLGSKDELETKKKGAEPSGEESPLRKYETTSKFKDNDKEKPKRASRRSQKAVKKQLPIKEKLKSYPTTRADEDEIAGDIAGIKPLRKTREKLPSKKKRQNYPTTPRNEDEIEDIADLKPLKGTREKLPSKKKRKNYPTRFGDEYEIGDTADLNPFQETRDKLPSKNKEKNYPTRPEVEYEIEDIADMKPLITTREKLSSKKKRKNYPTRPGKRDEPEDIADLKPFKATRKKLPNKKKWKNYPYRFGDEDEIGDTADTNPFQEIREKLPSKNKGKNYPTRPGVEYEIEDIADMKPLNMTREKLPSKNMRKIYPTRPGEKDELEDIVDFKPFKAAREKLPSKKKRKNYPIRPGEEDEIEDIADLKPLKAARERLPNKKKRKNYPPRQGDKDEIEDIADLKPLKAAREKLPSKKKQKNFPPIPGDEDEIKDIADLKPLKAARERLPNKKKRKHYLPRPGEEDKIEDIADLKPLKAVKEKLPSKKKRKTYPPRPGNEDEIEDIADLKPLKASRENLPSKKKSKNYPASSGDEDELEGDIADFKPLKAAREKLPSKKKRINYPTSSGDEDEIEDIADLKPLKASRENLPSKKKSKNYPAGSGDEDELEGDIADFKPLKAAREKLPSKKKRINYPTSSGDEDEIEDIADLKPLKASRERLPSKKKRKNYPPRPGNEDEIEDIADLKPFKASRENLPSKKKSKNYPTSSGDEDELEGDIADFKPLKAAREKLPSKKKRINYPTSSGDEDEIEDIADLKPLKASRERLPSKKKRENYPTSSGDEDEIEDIADLKPLKASRENLPSKKKRKNYHASSEDEDEIEDIADKAARKKLPSKKNRKNYPPRPGEDDEIEDIADLKPIKAAREKLPSKKKRKTYPSSSGDEDEIEDIADKAASKKLPIKKKRKNYPPRPVGEDEIEDIADLKPLQGAREKLPSKKKRKNYPPRSGDEDEIEDIAGLKPIKAARENLPSKKKRKNYSTRPGDEDETGNITDSEVFKSTREKLPHKKKRKYPTRRSGKANVKRTKKSRPQEERQTKDIIRKTHRPLQIRDLPKRIKRRNTIRKGTLRIVKTRSKKQRRIGTHDFINKPIIKKPTFRVVTHGTPEHKTFQLVQADDLTGATKIKKPSFRIFGKNTSSKMPGRAIREGRLNLVKKPAFRIMKNNIKKVQALKGGQTADVSNRFKNDPTLRNPQINHIDSSVIGDKRPNKFLRSYPLALFGKFDNVPTANELKPQNLKKTPVDDASMSNPTERNVKNRNLDDIPMTNATKRGSKKRTVDVAPMTNVTKRGYKKRTVDVAPMTNATKRGYKKRINVDVPITNTTKRGVKKRTLDDRTIANATKQRTTKKQKIEALPMPNGVKRSSKSQVVDDTPKYTITKTPKKYMQKDHVREYNKRPRNMPDISPVSAYPPKDALKEKKRKISNKLLSNAKERRRHPVSFRSIDIFGTRKSSPEFIPKLQLNTENGRTRNATVPGKPNLSINPKKRIYEEKKKRISNELLSDGKKRRKSPAAFRSENIFGEKKQFATSKKPGFKIFNDFPTKRASIAKKPGFRIFTDDLKKQRSDSHKRKQKNEFGRRGLNLTRGRDKNISSKKPGFRKLRKEPNELKPSGKKRNLIPSIGKNDYSTQHNSIPSTEKTPAMRNRELTNLNLVKKPAFRIIKKNERSVTSDANKQRNGKKLRTSLRKPTPHTSNTPVRFSKLTPSYSENEVTPPKAKKRRHHIFTGFAKHGALGKKLIPHRTRKLEFQHNPLLLNAKKRRRNPSAFRVNGIFTNPKSKSQPEGRNYTPPTKTKDLKGNTLKPVQWPDKPVRFSKLMPSYSENEVTPPKAKKRRHHNFTGFAKHGALGKKLIPHRTRKLEFQHNPLLLNAKKRRRNPSAFRVNGIFTNPLSKSQPEGRNYTLPTKTNDLKGNRLKPVQRPDKPVRFSMLTPSYSENEVTPPKSKKRRHHHFTVFAKHGPLGKKLKPRRTRKLEFQHNPLLLNAKKRRRNPSAFKEKSIFNMNKAASPTEKYGTSRSKYDPFFINAKKRRHNPSAFRVNGMFTNPKSKSQREGRSYTLPTKTKDLKENRLKLVQRPDHHEFIFTPAVIRLHPQPDKSESFGLNTNLTNFNKVHDGAQQNRLPSLKQRRKLYYFRITGGLDQRKQPQESKFGDRKHPVISTDIANGIQERKLALKKKHNDSNNGLFRKSPVRMTFPFKNGETLSKLNKQQALPGFYYDDLNFDLNKKPGIRTQSDDSGLNQNRNSYPSELNRQKQPNQQMLQSSKSPQQVAKWKTLPIGTQHMGRPNKPKSGINEIPKSPFVKTPTRQEYYQQGLVDTNNKKPMESSKNRKRKEKEQTNAKWKPNSSQRNDGKFPFLKHPHVKQEYYYRIQADPHDTNSLERNKRPANIPMITAPSINVQQIRNVSDTLPFRRQSSLPYAMPPFSFKKDTPSNNAIKEMKSSYQVKQPTDDKRHTQTDVWGNKLPNTDGYITKPPTDTGMHFYKRQKESPMKLANTASTNKRRGQPGKYGNMISDPGEFFPKTPSRKAFFFKTYGVAKPTARQMNSVPTTSTPPFNHSLTQAVAKEKPQSEKKQMQPAFRGPLVPKLLPARNHVRNYPQNRNMLTKPNLSNKQPDTSSVPKQYYYRMEGGQYRKNLPQMRSLTEHSNRTSPNQERGFPTSSKNKHLSPFMSQQRQKMRKPIKNRGNSIFGKKPQQLNSRPNDGKYYFFRNHELEPLKPIPMKQASVKGHPTPLSMSKPLQPQSKRQKEMPESNIVRRPKSDHPKDKQYYYRLTGGPTASQTKSRWSPNTSGWKGNKSPITTFNKNKLNFPLKLKAPNAEKHGWPSKSFFYKLTPNNDKIRPENDDMGLQEFHKLTIPLKSLTTEAPSTIFYYRPYGAPQTDIFSLPEEMRSEFAEINNTPVNFHTPHKKSNIFRKSVEETKPENSSKTASSKLNLLPSPQDLPKQPSAHIIHSDCCNNVTIFPFPISNFPPNKPTENPFLGNVRKRPELSNTTPPEARKATTTEATRKPYMYTAYELFQRKKKELYLKKQREAKSTPAPKKLHTSKKNPKVTPRRHFRKKEPGSPQRSKYAKIRKSPKNFYFYRGSATPQTSSKQETALEHPLLDNQGDQAPPSSPKNSKKDLLSLKLNRNSITSQPKTRSSQKLPNTELAIQVQHKGTAIPKFPRKKVVLGNAYYYRIAETPKPRNEKNKTLATKPKKSSKPKRPVGSFYYKVVTSPPDANYKSISVQSVVKTNTTHPPFTKMKNPFRPKPPAKFDYFKNTGPVFNEPFPPMFPPPPLFKPSPLPPFSLFPAIPLIPSLSPIPPLPKKSTKPKRPFGSFYYKVVTSPPDANYKSISVQSVVKTNTTHPPFTNIKNPFRPKPPAKLYYFKNTGPIFNEPFPQMWPPPPLFKPPPLPPFPSFPPFHSFPPIPPIPSLPPIPPLPSIPPERPVGSSYYKVVTSPPDANYKSVSVQSVVKTNTTHPPFTKIKNPFRPKLPSKFYYFKNTGPVFNEPFPLMLPPPPLFKPPPFPSFPPIAPIPSLPSIPPLPPIPPFPQLLPGSPLASLLGITKPHKHGKPRKTSDSGTSDDEHPIHHLLKVDDMASPSETRVPGKAISPMSSYNHYQQGSIYYGPQEEIEDGPSADVEVNYGSKPFSSNDYDYGNKPFKNADDEYENKRPFTKYDAEFPPDDSSEKLESNILTAEHSLQDQLYPARKTIPVYGKIKVQTSKHQHFGGLHSSPQHKTVTGPIGDFPSYARLRTWNPEETSAFVPSEKPKYHVEGKRYRSLEKNTRNYNSE